MVNTICTGKNDITFQIQHLSTKTTLFQKKKHFYEENKELGEEIF